jgi:hypothetical protein
VYGLSPEIYGVVFALNAAGLIIGAQVNGRIVGRIGPSLSRKKKAATNSGPEVLFWCWLFLRAAFAARSRRYQHKFWWQALRARPRS